MDKIKNEKRGKFDDEGEIIRPIEEVRDGAFEQLEVFVKKMNKHSDEKLKEVDSERKKKKVLDRVGEVYFFINSIFDECPDLVEFIIRGRVEIDLTREFAIIVADGIVGISFITTTSEDSQFYSHLINQQRIEAMYVQNIAKRQIEEFSNLTEEKIIKAIDSSLGFKRESEPNLVKKLLNFGRNR